MRTVRPSEHHVVKFEMVLEMRIDAAEVQGRCIHVVDFPCHDLKRQSRKIQEMYTRQAMSEYVNVWLDTIFENMVSDIP